MPVSTEAYITNVNKQIEDLRMTLSAEGSTALQDSAENILPIKAKRTSESDLRNTWKEEKEDAFRIAL